MAQNRYITPETETGAATPPPAKNGGGRGVGSLLRASRLRCGEELADISQILKVRLPYMEAIEEGRFGDLPGNTYAIGFIRAYADHLGLDSGEVVRRYKEDVADADKKSDLDFPVPVPESGIPGGAILFIGVAIAILAYGGWYASTTKNGFFAELISPVPKNIGSISAEAEKKAGTQATKEENSAPPQSQGGQSDVAAVAAAPVADAAEEAKAEKAPLAAAKPEPEETAPSIAPPASEPEADTATASTVSTASTASTVETVKTSETPAPPLPTSEASPTPPTSPTSPTSVALKAVKSVPAPTQPAPTHPEPASIAVATPAQPPPPEATAEAEIKKVAEKPRPEAAAVSITADEASKSASDTGRIVVLAKANSWIQVRDGIENQLVMTRLLRSGDSYRVPDKPGLKLLTGNAGGLEILVDGEAVPAIGGKGAVRRSVMLDADRLLAGTAVVE